MNTPRFAHKVALVTGGGSGIGAATCRCFAAEGAAVAIAEIQRDSGEKVAAGIRAQGGQARFFHADVSQEASIQAMVDGVVKTYGRLDIVVNNAAAFILRGIEATVDEWRRILDVNVIGPSLVVKYAAPHLRKAGGGAIVNLGSISSFIAQPQFVTYNSTKAAITGMTRCMALDLAADGIRVNAVCPGVVWTPIVQRLAAEDGCADRAAADAHPNWGGLHMLKRVADPEEIARAILFLASADASFITAECLMVDGGYVAV